MMADTDRLFDEKTLRKLERLMLVANHVRAGVMKGERRSTKRGTSIEFADYRNYTPGDDLRRLDWNVFARLERPFIKLFEEEEDLAVHVLLDASGSMDWPTDGPADHNKFRFAQRLAAGLGQISLGAGDRLVVAVPGTGYQWGPSRSRARALNLLEFIGALQPGGMIELNESLRQYALQSTRPGLCVIISDFLSPTGYQDGIGALQNRGHEVLMIHVLSPDEIDPPLVGDLQLIDVETGVPQSVTVDAPMKQLYADRLLAWRDEISAYCIRRGVHYATVETSTPWEELILFELRRLGVVH